MRLLTVIFIFTSIEAKRRRMENEHIDINRQIKTNDVDVYPERFSGAVDFGHVYKDDREVRPQTEPDMVEPKSFENARQILRKLGSDMVNMDKSELPKGFSSPRDAVLYNRRISPASNEWKNNSMERNHKPQRNRNFTQNIRKSVEEEINKKYLRQRVKTPTRSPPEGKVPKDDNDHKEKYFSKSGFNLVTGEETRHLENWTTCKEFAKGAVFHPDDVINLQWVPFFIWSTGRFVTSVVHTLAYPTKKLVKQYKEQYGPYLNMQLDWEQPKLILKESTDVLLIAGDRKGLFYGIPKVQLPSPVKGTEPETDEEKRAEASVLKFRGLGNPASRDLELEARKFKFELEMKQREEARKYLIIERPDDKLDPSLW